MNKNIKELLTNKNYLQAHFRQKKFRLIILIISGVILIPTQLVKADEIFLKCTGKYEINRGALIKPDWEVSYLTINLHGFKSSIIEKGIKKKGRTLIRRNQYTITQRDDIYKVNTIYKIHQTYGTYTVEYPQEKRTLIGTCQKARG